MQIFADNDWKIIKAAQPTTMEMPPLSQCSPWLCMNVLSLDSKTIFVEEGEKGMIELFNEHGFDTITLPFRDVFEFGGSFHCVTTDIRRQGSMQVRPKAPYGTHTRALALSRRPYRCGTLAPDDEAQRTRGSTQA